MARVRPAQAGWARFAVASVTALALASGAAAQNRIVLNPEFDDDLQAANWSGTNLSWVADDDPDACHLGPSLSGSLKAVSQPDAGSPGTSAAIVVAADCLNVTPGQEIQASILYKSAFSVGVSGRFYPLADCTGTPDLIDIPLNGAPSLTWAEHADSIVVPAARVSMQVVWASADFSNSVFDTAWDRAYAGADERVFGEAFEIVSFCRWGSVTGDDKIPPTDPGPIVSSSHDGGAAPPPILVSWGASTDSGGSGLRRYRIVFGIPSGSAPTPEELITGCADLTPYDLTTSASSPVDLPPGTYVFAVCAEDNAGNQSQMVVSSVYTVN